MICTQIKKTGNSVLPKLLKGLGKLAILMMLIGLTSCASNSLINVSDLNIYQPSTLRLKKNNPVQTIDGIYTPQTNEVWHSDARYRRLEREIYSK